eukprot:gb/GECH01011109.1/.p1 GENE.gb/GECH01011109.1/~~gb/GECH01011109.1/.p1  ORF type:complete len:1732 (+),score=240.69 gb/GECH01011109.1/:1-5196(+)
MVNHVIEIPDASEVAELHGRIYFVPCGACIKFVIPRGCKMCVPSTKLYTNFPLTTSNSDTTTDRVFHRRSFHEIVNGGINNRGDWTCTLIADRPGPYAYYVVAHKYRSRTGRFVVEPRLTVNGEYLPASGLCVQTVLTKCIGTLSGWRNSLGASRLSRYNMLHFTPVQPLGVSGSAYCIRDQLGIAPTLFVSNGSGNGASFYMSEEQQFRLLGEGVKQLEEEYSCLSMVDLVWNHTAVDTPWLPLHPDAGYTTKNTPHLKAAFELDEALYRFSVDLAAGRYRDEGVTGTIESEEMLQRVMHLLRTQVIPNARLFEYYIIDVDATIHAFANALHRKYSRPGYDEHVLFDLETSPLYSMEDISRMGMDARINMLRRDGLAHNNTPFGSHRFPYQVKLDVAMSLFSDRYKKQMMERGHSHPQFMPQTYSQYQTYQRLLSQLSAAGPSSAPSEHEIEDCCCDLRAALDRINLDFYRNYESDIDEIVRNITGAVRWERLNPNGPQRGPVTAQAPLVRRYFTVVKKPLQDMALGSDSPSEESEDVEDRLRSDVVEPLPLSLRYSRRSYRRTEDDKNRVLRYEDDLEREAVHHRIAFANNGWVMGANATYDFIGPGSKAYFLRQVVIWDDCVKLRYGKNPQSSPFLWEHMKTYTQKMAAVFHAFRIDNAHGTPLHVAEYLLDAAREVRPHLFVAAELFSGSEDRDREYVSRWGINAIIREAMNPSHPGELAAYIHWSADAPPVGCLAPPSVSVGTLTSSQDCHPSFPDGAAGKDKDRDNDNCSISSSADDRLLIPRRAPSLLYDCTHDNPLPSQKRTPQDTLPQGALIGMVPSAIGSVRGFDEVFPQQVDVVGEHRPYNFKTPMGCGIIRAKHNLNQLHAQMASEGYSELHVEQRKGCVLSLTRHHPQTYASYLIVASSSFNPVDYRSEAVGLSADELESLTSAAADPGQHAPISPFSPRYKQVQTYVDRYFAMRVSGVVDKVMFAGHLIVPEDAFDQWQQGRSKSRCLRGLPTYLRSFDSETINGLCGMHHVEDNHGKEETEIRFFNFAPGTVLVVHIAPPQSLQENAPPLQPFLDFVEHSHRLPSSPSDVFSRVHTAIQQLSFSQLNVLLYRCDAEERVSSSHGSRGVYDVPAYGPLVFSGLQGIVAVLNDLRVSRDLGHPLLENLRSGEWLMDYTLGRLRDPPPGVDSRSLSELADALQEAFTLVARLPRYLVPKFFDAVITTTHTLAVHQAIALMSSFVRHGTDLTQYLAINSVMLHSVVPGTGYRYEYEDGYSPLPSEERPSLAAGLPHFAAGFMRCWGRDTFIALRGLLLVTGRHREARELLLQAAALVRHGLIPNLLDGGGRPRYNSRDSVWWFMQALQEYTQFAEEGTAILDAEVVRRFPADTEEECECAGRTVQSLADIVQEIMEKHAQGISFREWYAGKSIDERMTDNGFNIEVHLDVETGFIFGGNVDNCGTWMDKMGESDLAENNGVPATPRDGAAVEIIGMLKSALRWLSSLHQQGRFPYAGVRLSPDASVSVFSFQEWNNRIQDHFERCFYIPPSPASDGHHVVRKDIVHRRGIYKDVYGSQKEYTDYQLRPNFCVALTVAPELFSRERALRALEITEDVLLGPLGMKTLDPRDWAYRGNYHNSVDSEDFHTARGFNYHQGPEWVWCRGYFLRAKLRFPENDLSSERVLVVQMLSFLRRHLMTSPWNSLPELTNENGAHCSDSCDAQSWSVATVLDTLYDVQNM